MPYIICPNCKFQTLSGYLYCKHCGLSLPGTSLPAGQPPDFVIVYSDAKSGKEQSFILPSTVTTIGRTEENMIVLADEEVSRHHAAIIRDPDGRYCIEDLRSTNGTFLNGTRINSPIPISLGDELWIGKTVLQFEKASRKASSLTGQPVFPDPESLNIESSPTERSYSPASPGINHNTNFTPVASEDCSVRPLDEDDGTYALVNQDETIFKKLNKRSVHMWNLMDGQHTLYDILVDYTQRFNAAGSDRLIDLVDELGEKGFLKNVVPGKQKKQSENIDTVAEESSSEQPEVSKFFLNGFDDWLTGFYNSFGWRLFTRTGQVVIGSITVFGFIALMMILFQNDYSLFTTGDSLPLGLLFLIIAHIISIVVHQFGHALTVKSYNRKIRQAGIRFEKGLPFLYVDTSDIWLDPRGPRIATFMAGTYSNVIFSAIIALIMLIVRDTFINSILFKLTAWSMIVAFFNLNPLLDLDGYHTMMDLMEIPQLRKRSFEFGRTVFLKKLFRISKEPFSKDEVQYTLFGVLSFLWLLIAARIIFIYVRPVWRRMGLPGL